MNIDVKSTPIEVLLWPHIVELRRQASIYPRTPVSSPISTMPIAPSITSLGRIEKVKKYIEEHSQE